MGGWVGGWVDETYLVCPCLAFLLHVQEGVGGVVHGSDLEEVAHALALLYLQVFLFGVVQGWRWVGGWVGGWVGKQTR